MISDYHMHTSFSGDSTADPHDMADRAISLGMKSICITDHMDTDSEEPEFILDTDRYLPYMERLRKEYEGRLDIRIGGNRNADRPGRAPLRVCKTVSL